MNVEVEVSYLVRKFVQVELTEALFRELYNKYKNSALSRMMILDEICEYLEQESGYIAADGQELEYDTDIESWVLDMYEKVRKEEEY